MWALLTMMTGRNRRNPIGPWIEVVVVGHVQLLRRSQINLWLVVMVIVGVMVFVRLVCIWRGGGMGLLGRLPWLVMMMVILGRRRYVTSSGRSGRNIHMALVLSVHRGARGRIHSFIGNSLWCLRGHWVSRYDIIQTYLLSIIQKVWKCRLLPRILVSCFRDATSLSRRCRVSSFLSTALFTTINCSHILAARCILGNICIFLALPHWWGSALWNWGWVVRVGPIMIRRVENFDHFSLSVWVLNTQAISLWHVALSSLGPFGRSTNFLTHGLLVRYLNLLSGTKLVLLTILTALSVLRNQIAWCLIHIIRIVEHRRPAAILLLQLKMLLIWLGLFEAHAAEAVGIIRHAKIFNLGLVISEAGPLSLL